MKHEVLEESQCTTVCCKILSFTQYVICLLLLSSCSLNKTSKDNVLNANLQEEPVSVKELFSKISVIPLETNDSALLIRPHKILIKDNEYYVFDERVPATFIFNEQGKFLRKIGRKGQGPGEYREIYDAVISRYSNTLYMLSPFGKVFCYDLTGKFLKEIDLPAKSNYQSMEEYDEDLLILYTLPSYLEEPAISIVSKTTMKEVKSYWHQNRILCGLNSRMFYLYQNKVYFSTPFNRKVYQVGLDSLKNIYSWDFDKSNIDLKKYLTLDISKNIEENKLMDKYLLDSTIPYFMAQQYQNKTFYYSRLTYGFKTPKSLFYRKSDNKTFFFEKTSEGIPLNALYFDDDCLMCIVYKEDYPAFKNVLPKEDYQKLEQRSDDDNPCLIKFYFKQN